MNLIDINKFSYLWDGSEPHWYLKQLPEIMEVMLDFGGMGFTSKDALKLKKHISRFSTSSIVDLYDCYKELNEISLGEVEKDNAIVLKENLQIADFNVKLKIVENRYVIINKKENTILLIEDNDVYQLVKERMLLEGLLIG